MHQWSKIKKNSSTPNKKCPGTVLNVFTQVLLAPKISHKKRSLHKYLSRKYCSPNSKFLNPSQLISLFYNYFLSKFGQQHSSLFWKRQSAK